MGRSDRVIRFSGDQRRSFGFLHFHVDVDVDILVQVIARQRRRRDLRSRNLSGGVHSCAALVMHQVVPPSETHLTMFALERFLPFVYQQMSLQLIGIAEFSRAQFASVRTFTGVDAQMATKVRYLHELTVAVAAVIRFLTGMQSHVSLQMMVPSESVTIKRESFLSIRKRETTNVSEGKIERIDPPFVTFRTLERFLPGVSAFVIL